MTLSQKIAAALDANTEVHMPALRPSRVEEGPHRLPST